MDTIDKELPRDMRAVLTIFCADKELERKALPHVNIEQREIDWYEILGHNFAAGERAAILWARLIWTGTMPKGGAEPFNRALAMDDNLKDAVLDALAIQWGVAD